MLGVDYWFNTLMIFISLIIQQSSAFKILRTRLKTVPSHSFMHTQPHVASTASEFPGLSAIRRSASAGPYTQILAHVPSIPVSSLTLQATDPDGEKTADITSNGSAAGINFASQLKQFEHIQQQHRLHQSADNILKPPRRPPVIPNQVSFFST